MESSGYWITRQNLLPKQMFLWRRSIMEVKHVMQDDKEKDLEVDKVNEKVAGWLVNRKHPIIDLETYSYMKSIPIPAGFSPLVVEEWLKSLDAHSSRGRGKHVNAKVMVAAPPERKLGRCWKCGSQQHMLSRCPQATEEEKMKIFRDKWMQGGKREAAATLKIQDHYVRVLFDPGNSAASLCSPNVLRWAGASSTLATWR